MSYFEDSLSSLYVDDADEDDDEETDGLHVDDHSLERDYGEQDSMALS